MRNDRMDVRGQAEAFLEGKGQIAARVKGRDARKPTDWLMAAQSKIHEESLLALQQDTGTTATLVASGRSELCSLERGRTRVHGQTLADGASLNADTHARMQSLLEKGSTRRTVKMHGLAPTGVRNMDVRNSSCLR